MRSQRLAYIVLGSLLGMLFIHPAVTHAQDTQATAKIEGTVIDPSGAAIVGAAISAQVLDSSAKPVQAQSGREGAFALALPPGRYRLSIEFKSFAHAEQEFTLSEGETRTCDVRLELERMSSNVVVTASAEPSTAETTPALADVVTREQIDQRQALSVLDMLASEQGAAFGRYGPYGGIASFFLDGGNSNYTKVLVDGTPVNQPGGAVDFSNLMLDGVDKIEIVHGASSALYGSDAMSGVVQIFTHRGTTRKPQLSLEGDGGTFGTGHGNGQLSGLLGAFDYSLGAGYFSTGGQGPGNYFRDTTLSGNFGWKLSETDSLRLTLRNSASDAGQPGQTLLADLSPYAVDFGQHSDLHDFSSNLSWRFATGPRWQHQLSGFESRFQDFGVSPAYDFTSLTKYNRAGLDEQSTYLFHNGGVTAGYMFEVENGGTQGRQNQAGYVEARYQFGRRLTAIAGGRIEANGFFGTRAVPRAGASYALRYGPGFWGATRVRASYGKGIKEPQLLPPGCSPQLDPERSATFDAGIDQALASDRLHVSVTYFHNSFRDIVSFAWGAPSPNCPAYGGSFFNTDEARAFGSNARIEAAPFRWLSVVGNYTYDDSRVLKTANPLMDPALAAGNRLFRRPLNSANLMLNAHFRRVNWNLTGYYVGPRTDSDFLSYTVDGVCYGPCITNNPGYVRWDMATIVPLRYGVSATAHIENLFDRHYQDAVGYPALGYNYRVGIKYVRGRE
jgi:vitamin B12 transporter